MPRQVALRWGYAITACGFLFLFGPASVAASFARATTPRHAVRPGRGFGHALRLVCQR
jgi:hypothetical protein